MLKNNKANMVIALIIAIVLWVYVLANNPETTAVVRDVPITITNLEQLENDGLTVLSMDYETVNVTVSGQRTSVNLSSQDFSVTIDVEGLREGENVVRLEAKGPSDVSIKSISSEKVKVTVDKYAEAEKPVYVIVSGEAEEKNTEPYIVEQSLSKVKVMGPSSLVANVDYVAAYLYAQDVSDKLDTCETKLVPVSANGEQVERVRTSAAKMKVSCLLQETKTVNLVVPVKGKIEALNQAVNAPKTVLVKGAKDILKDVTEITCQAIDLSTITEDQEVKLSAILPEGIELSSENINLTAKIVVKEVNTKNVEFNVENISLVNKDESLKYLIQGKEVKITVVGADNVLSQISPKDFDVILDCSKLSEGVNNAKIDIVCEKDVTVIGEVSIKVNVERGE